jgi:succinate dehydrogenase hydrophobic anchor subunit
MRAASGPNETAWIWFLKIATGVLVVIFILVHLVVNHLMAEGGLMSYLDVVRYLANPWISFMEGSFLVIVVTHSLVGTRSIILDLDPSAWLQKVIDVFLFMLGVGSVIYGIWLLRLIASRGGG